MIAVIAAHLAVSFYTAPVDEHLLKVRKSRWYKIWRNFDFGDRIFTGFRRAASYSDCRNTPDALNSNDESFTVLLRRTFDPFLGQDILILLDLIARSRKFYLFGPRRARGSRSHALLRARFDLPCSMRSDGQGEHAIMAQLWRAARLERYKQCRMRGACSGLRSRMCESGSLKLT